MPNQNDPRGYLSPAQVARLWGVTDQTVRRMIKSGRLPADVTPTGRFRVRSADAELRPALAS